MTESSTRFAFIINPSSGNGRTTRLWRTLEDDLRRRIGQYKVFETKEPGHATELVRDALDSGFERIVSVGGDGTHFEVVNGFFRDFSPINPNASMAILPLGTGADLAKSLRISRGPRSVEHLLSDPVTVDLGKLTVTRDNDLQTSMLFLTSVHMGVGGLVVEQVNRRSKILGGFLTFLLGVVTARLSYSNLPMIVRVDDREFSLKCLEIIVANAQYDGGGMRTAPMAKMNDGLFDVYVIGDVGLVGTALSLPRIYMGTLHKHPKVEYMRAKRIEVQSEERVLVSPDGEWGGTLPATVEIVPGAIKLVTGPRSPVV